MPRSAHKPIELLVLSSIIGLAGGTTCCAGLVGLSAWTHEYQEGRFVFVMVPTDRQYQEEWDSLMDEPWGQAWEKTDDAKRAGRLRSLYAKNGLYLNDGTYKLMWRFPSWTYGPPYLSANGRFAVFPGRWSEDFMNLSNPGWRANVADFVIDGAVIASYNAEDLVAFPMLKCIVTQQIFSCDKEIFDADALTYTVATRWGEEIVFDITTGKIVHHYRPIELITLAVMLFGVSCVVTYLLWKNRRRKRPLRCQTNGP